MPTINMDNVQLLNTVRQYAPVDYQNRIPAVTQGNIQSALQGFQSYTPSWDTFLGVFLEKIGLQIVRKTTWDNPFGIFKRAPMRLGAKIEEVAINLQRAHSYQNNCTDVFGVEPPDTRVAFHSQNRHDYYKVTVPLEEVIRGAAIDEYFLSSYLGALVDNLIVSDNADEYLIFKKLLAAANEANAFYNVQVADVLSANDKAAAARALVEQVRGMYRMVKFPSADYSIEGRKRGLITVGRDMVLIIDARTEAAIDVESLAAAFHMDKADFLADSVAVIDKWPAGLEGTQAMLVDRDFFVVTDTLLSMQAAPVNPCNMSVNHYYHHWGVYSFSMFTPCIRFSTDASTVLPDDSIAITDLTLSIDTATAIGIGSGNGTSNNPYEISIGGSVKIVPTVTGTVGDNHGVDLNSVEYSIIAYDGSGNRYNPAPSDCRIDRNGIFVVGNTIQPGGLISIGVKSTLDPDSKKLIYFTIVANR